MSNPRHIDHDAKETLKHYTTAQLFEIERECATAAGKWRIRREIARRRRNEHRAAQRRLAQKGSA
jgi:hypothetical protein